MSDEVHSDDPARVAAGELAGRVCRQMVKPLRELREDLAVLVEQLDRHIGESKGPRALPWRDVELMRQELAACYLRCRQSTRLASELAVAVAGGGVRGPVDVNRVVEAALNLARVEIAEETEVFVDLGAMPMVRAVEGDLLLALARILGLSASSAARSEGSAISIKTRLDGDDAMIFVADNGAGCPEGVAIATAIAEAAVEPSGGVVDATSEKGAGSAFELRMPVVR